MVNVAETREKVGSSIVQQSRIQCFNCKEFGHFFKECKKTKRVKDSAYHKEKMLLCKQAEQGVPLQANLIPAESNSLPHAHAQNTKTYYKHQDLRIKKAQELKTKTSLNSYIKDNSSETKLWGRLLKSFQEDAKYEHVGQHTRSQDGKDDQD
nr:hypothetical protein [Tanacetum cinerariifolium]